MSSAIVVGAGMSGLAAAWRLQQAGFEVTVLERDDHPGGLARTAKHENYLIDTGPDAITEGYEHYLALLEEFGFADRLEHSSEIVGIVRNGRLIEADPGSLFSLIRTPMLSLGGKLGMVRGYLALRKEVRGVDGYEQIESADLDDPDGDAWSLAVKHFGDDAAELLDGVLRLTTGSKARDATPLSVHVALDGWTKPMVGVRGGMGLLPQAMGERLDIRYGTGVTAVREESDGVTVECAGGQTLAADCCVLAVMYEPACDIWEPLEGFAPGYREHLEYVKLVSVSLGYTAPASTRAYTVLTPTSEMPDVLGMFMQQHKVSDRAPAGHTLVTLYAATDVYDDYAALPDDEIVTWAAERVESICPELAGHRDAESVERFPYTGYLPIPGFWRRTADLHRALPADGRVQLAGALFGAAGMESAVRWGERAATRLIHNHKRVDARQQVVPQ